MMDDELARVLDDTYLGDVAMLDAEELRVRRTDCQEVEGKLSYLRRMVQGRLDIVSAELARRAGGAPPGDLSDLVEQLPQILSDRVRAPGPGRMPTDFFPPDDDTLTAELDTVSGPTALGSLPDLSDVELQNVAGRLGELEKRVSEQRRAVFGVIDALQAEITSRYEQDETATT